MKLLYMGRHEAEPSGPARRRASTVVPLALAFAMVLGSVAYGAVWTDQDDYSPGSVVTLSGDNSNDAGYLAGETVLVEVWGPNDYTASCEAVADEVGAWSCQITLWADERAVGDYTYAATGQTSGVSENGVFSDGHGTHNFRFVTAGLPAGVPITVTGSRTNPGHNVANYSVGLTSPGPSATTGAQAGGGTSTVSYSGFPASVTTGGQICTLLGSSPASGFATGAAGGLTTVTATYSCVSANTAPTTPGAPALTLGSNPNNTGLFTLGWTASTDAESNPITYLLQHKDADDPDFTGVASASSLSVNSYSFTGSGEVEGTWLYRVQASDGSLSSAFSANSVKIKVDKTAPNAPSVSADRSPDYSGDGGWYLDTVTVSTSDNGDPALLDGSTGSGVDLSSVAGPSVFNTSGSHTANRTVTDLAGNVSSGSSLTVQVDATNPVVNIGCPVGPVIQSSTAYASWLAHDDHSGLATASSGSVALDTATIGSKNATAPTATDNVGRTSDETTCGYSVIYSFSGFFRPVDNLPVVNMVKAGSAIPVKFSLGGNQGLTIFEAGYPKSVSIPCSPGWWAGGVEDTVPGSQSSLSYDADNDQYNYVWKTNKNWTGCRQLQLGLVDGQMYVANFWFK